MIRENTKDDIRNAASAAKTAAQSVVEDGQDTMHDMAGCVKDQAAAATDSLRDKAADMTADVTARVKDAAASAADYAGKKVDDAKDSIANEGQRLAQSLRSAASDRGETVQGRVLDVVAGGVEQVAESVRGRSLTGLFADVQTFARRNPGAFVAGAAVVGFALARFVRSGSNSGTGDGKSWENRS